MQVPESREVREKRARLVDLVCERHGRLARWRFPVTRIDRGQVETDVKCMSVAGVDALLAELDREAPGRVW